MNQNKSLIEIQLTDKSKKLWTCKGITIEQPEITYKMKDKFSYTEKKNRINVAMLILTLISLGAAIFMMCACAGTVIVERPDGTTTYANGSFLEDTDAEGREFSTAKGTKYAEQKINKDQTNVALAGVAAYGAPKLVEAANQVPLSGEKTTRAQIKSTESVKKAKINADLQKALAP